MQRAGSVLKNLAGDLGIDGALRLYRIKSEWDVLFPGPLSLHSYPSSLRNGMLVLNVDSSAWLQELSFIKTDIIGKLAHFGVSDIRLKQGRTNTGRGFNINPVKKSGG